jgi:hypothetical protein
VIILDADENFLSCTSKQNMARVMNQQQAMIAMAALVIALRLFKGRSGAETRSSGGQGRGVADL